MTSIFQNSAVYSLSSSASQPALSSASSRPKQLYQKGKLTEEGRAHLLAIKQREELKNHLVTKYETKYGEKKPSTAPKSASESNQSLSATAPVDASTTLSSPTSAQVNFELSMKDPASKPADQAERKRVTRSSSSMPATGEWAEMSEHNRKQFLKFEEMEKELHRQSQVRIKRDLDQQIAEIEHKRLHKDDHKSGEKAAVEADVIKYMEEEKKKAAQRKAFLMSDREVRSQQIRDTIIRRQQEHERNLRQEEQLVLRVQAEMAAEKERQRLKKLEGLEAVKLVVEDNMKQRGIKDALKKKDEEESMRLQKQYIAMLDKQERDRHMAMQNILDMQARSQAIYSASVGSTLASQAKEDEQRAAEMQAEFNRARLAQEAVKAEEKKKLEQAVQDSLFNQIQERARRKLEEKQWSDSYASNIQLAMEKMRVAEEAHKLEEARMKDKTRKDLDDQMEDIIRRRSEDLNMSSHERKLNAQLLEKVRRGESDIIFNKDHFDATGIAWMALKRKTPY